jgi:hypothetical protein
MRALAPVLLACALAACGTANPHGDGVLQQADAAAESLSGDYAIIASCAYTRLDRLFGAGLKKVDMTDTKTSIIAQESGGVRYWELTLQGAGPKRTEAKMTVVRTIWGPDRAPVGPVMGAVKGCQA